MIKIKYTIRVMFFQKLKNIFNHLNFKFQKIDFLALIAMTLSAICIKIFNITKIPENSFLENISLIPLAIGVFLCFRTKKCKVFFNVVAFIFILMILRELSYGRVIFCQIPNQPNEFYQWSHYKYGFLANIAIGAYIFGIFLYGILNKVFLDIIKILNKVPTPFWSFLCSFICIFIQIYSEKSHNTCLEETMELGLYLFMVSICITYIKKLNT